MAVWNCISNGNSLREQVRHLFQSTHGTQQNSWYTVSLNQAPYTFWGHRKYLPRHCQRRSSQAYLMSGSFSGGYNINTEELTQHVCLNMYLAPIQVLQRAKSLLKCNKPYTAQCVYHPWTYLRSFTFGTHNGFKSVYRVTRRSACIFAYLLRDSSNILFSPLFPQRRLHCMAAMSVFEIRIKSALSQSITA